MLRKSPQVEKAQKFVKRAVDLDTGAITQMLSYLVQLAKERDIKLDITLPKAEKEVGMLKEVEYPPQDEIAAQKSIMEIGTELLVDPEIPFVYSKIERNPDLDLGEALFQVDPETFDILSREFDIKNNGENNFPAIFRWHRRKRNLMCNFRYEKISRFFSKVEGVKSLHSLSLVQGARKLALD